MSSVVRNGKNETGKMKTVSPAGRKNIFLLNLPVIILFLMICSIILISLSLPMPAGIILIAACCLEIIHIRNSSAIEKTLLAKIDDLTESGMAKDNVITGFSHKIREPLNNLVVVGEMLHNADLRQKQKELVETLSASTKNMSDTLNLLTMQSAGTVYEERKKIRFNLISTVQNTIDLFRLKDPAYIDFILSEKETDNYEVSGDPIVLKQILLDIFNIIEIHGREIPSKVNISITKKGDDAQVCTVIFRIQADKKISVLNSNEPAGMHAAKLIREAGGIYNLEGGENHTVLTFSLTYLNVVHDEKKLLASPKIESLKLKEKSKKELKDANILLVEDNPINQKITLLTLKPLVNNIDTASDGREALEKFGNSSYDLILMDIQMPVMSGLIAAEKIRALEASTNSHVPIIAITANAMLGDKERCMAAGMDDYISKPFQPYSLIEKIKKHL